MKSNLHFNKSRPVLFVFIVCCALSILILSKFMLSPADSTQPLKVLALNQDTKPIFHITSQITYTPSNVATILKQLPQQSGASSPELSLMLPLNSSQDSNLASSDTQELSPTTSPNSVIKFDEIELNLLLQLTDDWDDYLNLNADLSLLSRFLPHTTLSILPSEHMSDEAYLEVYNRIYDYLKSNQFGNISLIAYPASTGNLSLYDIPAVRSLGTVLNSESDLKCLDKIYTQFADTKSLVVRDAIKSFYTDNPKIAAREIASSYYMLAVNYPRVETIFSPCVNPLFLLDEDYVLNANDKDFSLFNTIYSRLLSKPWLTTTLEGVHSISPYHPIKNYDLLTGKSEIILSPEMLSSFNLDEETLYFKWNEEYLSVNNYYPYAIFIDTANEPNGLSRLSVILETKEKENSYETYAIDLDIEHDVTTTRAQRIESKVQEHPASVAPSKTYIPVLMYHTVEDIVAPDKQNSHVETSVFEAQMKALVENGYNPINFSDLKKYKDGLATLPEHPIIITMDDGYLNNYTNAYPIYKKYGIQATLFVSPYYMEDENTERHFGWNAAKAMEDSGLIDIQPHGYNHTPLPYLSVKDATYHASHARGLIEMNLGPRDVSVLAYPQFRHNRHTDKLLNDLGFDFQIINLAKTKAFELGTVLSPHPSFNPPKLQRINVPNTMSPEELIETLNKVTSS